jgi:hypothetical protein
MLITPQFLFLHIPKTGGVFLRTACYKHFDCVPETDDSTHWTYEQIPEEFRHLPRFALVRNPWDWYVSWYAYMLENEREALKDLLDDGFSSFVERSFLDPMYQRPRPGPGIYMYHVHLTVGPMRNPQAELGRNERLAEDFLSFLASHGIEEPVGLRDDLYGPRQNTSNRGDYRDYYDEPSMQLVKDACLPLIDKFDYTF